MDKERILIDLVESLLTIIANDDVGNTHELTDLALQAGECLGLSKDYMDAILNGR